MKHVVFLTVLTLGGLSSCFADTPSTAQHSSSSQFSMSAEQIHAALQPSIQTFDTPLGPAYISAHKDFIVNNKVVIKGGRVCGWHPEDTYPMSLYMKDWEVLRDSNGKKIRNQDNGFTFLRLLIQENNAGQNCGNYIVDLTGAEPRVSNRFGDSDTTPNAGGQYVEINWKEKKPTIRFRFNKDDSDYSGIYRYDPATGKVTSKEDE